MLILIGELALEVLPFVHSADVASSALFIFTVNRVQQGDPLSLLFCLAIRPLTKQLTYELRVVYLDNGTVGGRVGEENDINAALLN